MKLNKASVILCDEYLNGTYSAEKFKRIVGRVSPQIAKKLHNYIRYKKRHKQYRYYTNWHIGSTVTGRLASSQHNLQFQNISRK